MSLDIANKQSSYFAEQACVRLLNINASVLSKWPTANDGSGAIIKWIPVTTNEYTEESITEAFNDWCALRNEAHAIVQEAIQQASVRSRNRVILESVLPDDTRRGPVTSKISVIDQTRGQSWAIVAIIGDAKHYKAKDAILNALAQEYVEHIQTVAPSDSEDISIAQYMHLDEPVPFKGITEALKKIEALGECVPLISFFGASEDAADLVEKSKKLTAVPELKHADIAVVKMYEWLKLETKANCSRSARDPKAQEFFETMRQTKSD
jgi:hypothetical protein